MFQTSINTTSAPVTFNSRHNATTTVLSYTLVQRFAIGKNLPTALKYHLRREIYFWMMLVLKVNSERYIYIYIYIYIYFYVTPWSGILLEANKFSDSQEIPHTLCNPKVHYCTHNSPPTVPMLCQINPVHGPSSHFLKIIFYTIQPSTPRSSKWSHALRFTHQTPVCTSPGSHTCYMFAHFILLDLIAGIIFSEEYTS